MKRVDSLCHQAGVALITVLLIVFLASIAATSLASLQQLAIRRSILLQHQQQARLYTLGAEQWAAVILKRDRENGDTDYLDEDWAQIPPTLPVQGGQITGRIEDLQGRFNLNNLLKQDCNAINDNASEQETIDPEQFKILQRLLEILQLEPAIAQAIADWIDSDQQTRFPDGAENGYYLGLDTPYLAANRCLISLSELRLIKGIDQNVYAKLAPNVSTLPSTKIRVNVNTAPAPVLAALDDNLDLSKAETLIEDRGTADYRDVETFLKAAGLSDNPPLKQRIAVSSHYFLLRIEAQVGEGRARLYSVLQRTDKGGSRILMHSFGNQE
jgi:general secretion pathway protein K